MNNIDNFISSGTWLPELFKFNRLNTSYVIVPIILKEEIIDDKKTYTWIEIQIKEEKYTYEDVIDFIITLKYSISETIAIINNYMYDPENEKYKSEFKEFQEFRTLVKNGVKKHFNKL